MHLLDVTDLSRTLVRKYKSRQSEVRNHSLVNGEFGLVRLLIC